MCRPDINSSYLQRIPTTSYKIPMIRSTKIMTSGRLETSVKIVSPHALSRHAYALTIYPQIAPEPQAFRK